MKLKLRLDMLLTKKDIPTPTGTNMDANACTGLAFDNYDHFVETSTGKDTLHDTVGYQSFRKPRNH